MVYGQNNKPLSYAGSLNLAGGNQVFRQNNGSSHLHLGQID
jgi:hypothetical protein